MRWTQSRRPWMLALVDRSPRGIDGAPPAVPTAYRGTEGRPGPVLFTLDVDGERFAIRRAGDGGTAYDWLSGADRGLEMSMPMLGERHASGRLTIGRVLAA